MTILQGLTTMVLTADDVDAAYDRVVASDVRYRFVIDTATLEAPTTA